MLSLEIVSIGRDQEPWISAGMAHYQKLLKKHAAVTLTPIKPPSIPPSMPPETVKAREAVLFATQTFRGLTIALSDKGRAFDSPELSRILEQWVGRCQGRMRFLIGGAHGLHDSVISRADELLSLSPLTFSHQLARLVLLEQLYRAFSILHGDPYHK